MYLFFPYIILYLDIQLFKSNINVDNDRYIVPHCIRFLQFFITIVYFNMKQTYK